MEILKNMIEIIDQLLATYFIGRVAIGIIVFILLFMVLYKFSNLQLVYDILISLVFSIVVFSLMTYVYYWFR